MEEKDHGQHGAYDVSGGLGHQGREDRRADGDAGDQRRVVCSGYKMGLL